MEFSASFDNTAIFLTAFVTAIILLALPQFVRRWKASKGRRSGWMWFGAVTAVFLLFALGYCYLFHPQKYYVKGGDLIIKRPWSDVHIKIADILDCRTLSDADMNGTIRTFGVGGLFGYFGSYHNPMIGDMTFYATQRKNLILIHATEGRAIILSPDKPADFAHEITADITPNN